MTAEQNFPAAPVRSGANDTALAEERAPKIRYKLVDKPDKTYKKPKTPLPIGVIIVSFICGLLMMFTVFVSVQINDYTAQVSELNTQLNSLISEESRINTRLSQKNDLQYIEKAAVEQYGMVKSDKLPKRYVSISGGDEVEVFEQTADDEYSLASLFSAIGDSLSEILEYINK